MSLIVSYNVSSCGVLEGVVVCRDRCRVGVVSERGWECAASVCVVPCIIQDIVVCYLFCYQVSVLIVLLV